jgi:hypothetical protein
VYGSLVTPVPGDAAAQAIIDAAVAAGSQFNNFSGTGAAGIRYLLDIRQQNASMVDQTGFDITSRYTRPIASHTLIAQLNISSIDKIETRLSPGAAFDNLQCSHFRISIRAQCPEVRGQRHRPPCRAFSEDRKTRAAGTARKIDQIPSR